MTNADDFEFVPGHVLDGGRDFRVEGNDVSGYLGVDPEYQTYASETSKPMLTDTERYDLTDQYAHLEGNHEDDEPDEVQSPDGDDSTGGTENKLLELGGSTPGLKLDILG